MTIEQIRENLFKIEIPLPGNPLKNLNSYFIADRDRPLLIDTGFRRPACREAMTEALAQLSVDRSKLDVCVTHMHSDHCGLSQELASRDGRIYMSGMDLYILRRMLAGTIRGARVKRFLREGYPQELLDRVESNMNLYRESVESVDERFCEVGETSVIRAGGYELHPVIVPGHTPGNMMLWDPAKRIMFTGDHILFGITPNIAVWTGIEDSLGNYLESLKKAHRFDPELSLPAHRQTGDYHARIDSLIAHHERRLAETERIVMENPGITAYDSAGMMHWKIRTAHGTWEEFPDMQRWFAMGECLAHMDYLVRRKRIRRDLAEESGDLVRYYPL